jgi:hypothetical protein
MSEKLHVSSSGRDPDAWIVDEFYVRRINWLVALDRADLIDEIADDCERRRQPIARRDSSRPVPVEHRPCRAVRHVRSGQTDLRAVAAPPPRPVEAGTQIAVARLRRARA